MKTLRESLKEKLELYADLKGMYAVRELISEICFEKASHVRENYPESTGLANSWDRIGEGYLSISFNDSDKLLEEIGA